MMTLFFKMYELMNATSVKLLDSHYCLLLESCEDNDLLAAQLAGSTLTLNPLPGLFTAPSRTLCGKLYACSAPPELPAFLYATHAKLDTAFSAGQLKRLLFCHDDPAREDCLLHVGNLQALLRNATLYLSLNDDFYLQQVQSRFGLASLQQALVLYQWVQYLPQSFFPHDSQFSLYLSGLASKTLRRAF